MRFFLLLIGVFSIYTSHAQPIINITNQTTNIDIADIRKSMWIYEEPDGQFHSIKQIRLLPTTFFKPIEQPISGIIPKNVWLKFVVNNQSSEDAIIDIAPSVADSVSLYCVKPDGEIVQSSTGLSFPFRERAIKHSNQNLKLQGDKNVNQIYYLYVKNQFPTNFKFRITLFSQFFNLYHHESILSGLLFGILWSCVLISFVMYAALKKPSYLWFGVYLVSLIFMLGYYYGYFQQFIFPNTPQYNSYTCLFVNFPTLLGVLYQLYFLKIKKNLPFYHTLSLIFIGICMVNIGIGFLGYINLSIFITHILAIPSTLLTLSLSFKLYSSKNVPLLLMALGTIALNITLSIYMIDNTSLLLAPSIKIKNVLHIGMIVQAFFLTLSMAQQVRQIMTEKNKNKILYIELLRDNKELIHKQNIELEKRIQERTQELQAALDREKDRELRLSKSNKELTEFAHIVSHDLKAPLRNITSFSQLMARRVSGKLDGADKEYMDYIISSAKQGTQLVEDLLNYSKLDKNIGNALFTDMNEVVSNVIVNNSNILKDRNAEVFSHFLPNINAHKSLVTTLWQNLILNGIKYNMSQSPSIEIGVFKNEESIIFWVRDNGIGISSQYQEEVFRMFRRLHTSDKYEGTGIGLAFCKRIVDFYEGKIWFESVEEEGTTFFFTLPNAYTSHQRELNNKNAPPSVLAA